MSYSKPQIIYRYLKSYGSHTYMNTVSDLSKNLFKRTIQQLLFKILEKEDAYIQITMIIEKIKKYRY
jgi:hypothetical protein